MKKDIALRIKRGDGGWNELGTQEYGTILVDAAILGSAGSNVHAHVQFTSGLCQRYCDYHRRGARLECLER